MTTFGIAFYESNLSTGPSVEGPLNGPSTTSPTATALSSVSTTVCQKLSATISCTPQAYAEGDNGDL